MWDLWWTKWHWHRFFRPPVSFFFSFTIISPPPPTRVPFSFIHHRCCLPSAINACTLWQGWRKFYIQVKRTICKYNLVTSTALGEKAVHLNRRASSQACSKQPGNWELTQPSLEDGGKTKHPASRRPVGGPSGYIPTPSQQAVRGQKTNTFFKTIQEFCNDQKNPCDETGWLRRLKVI